jgi:hypothetical protein
VHSLNRRPSRPQPRVSRKTNRAVSNYPVNERGQAEESGVTYSEFRGNWGVVDVARNVLNLGIVVPCLQWRRSAGLQRRHGGGGELFVGGASGRSGQYTCPACRGERGTQSSGLEGWQSQVSGSCADTAIDCRHRLSNSEEKGDWGRRRYILARLGRRRVEARNWLLKSRSGRRVLPGS